MTGKVLNIKKCPIRKALKILGGKWALLIIFALKSAEKRFSELKREIPDISEKMLIHNLKTLEAEGYIHRQDYNQVPPKVGYSLSEKGKLVLPMLSEVIIIGKMDI